MRYFGQVLERCDLAPGVIEVVDAAQAPTLARSPAAETPEGYLIVDALIARDGLLQYSDGTDTWVEYRSRQTLVDASQSWAATPYVDNHPKKLVTSQTWAQLAKGGHVAGSLRVLEPDADGVSYLAARILIQDARQIARVRAGKTQLSVGFKALITPLLGGVARDGTRADAEQERMIGNHTAGVLRGRAGPQVRLLLDGADTPVYNAPEHMRTQKATPQVVSDEIGAPVEDAQVKGPDGQEITVPTWVAAKLAELDALQAGAPPAPPAAPPAAPMAPPATPVAAAPLDAAQPVPVPGVQPVAAEPMDAKPAFPGAAPPIGGPPAPEPGAPKKEDAMTADAINVLVAKRARLVRHAVAAGVEAVVCDAADPDLVGRAYLAKVQPWLTTERLDSLDSIALDSAVESAMLMPAEPALTNPIPIHDPRTRNDSADTPEEAAEAKTEAAKILTALGAAC